MNSEILWVDSLGNEVHEYDIICSFWADCIDINNLYKADPRLYAVLKGSDGKVYAISVYDNERGYLIRQREQLGNVDEIPVIVRPISDMNDYVLAKSMDNKKIITGPRRFILKHQLEIIIKDGRFLTRLRQVIK